MSQRIKILVSAYSCEPNRGSEGEIGWRLAIRLARNNDVWLITRENLRPVHELAFRQTPKPPHLNFIYFDLPLVFRFYKKGARFFLAYYYMWQIGVAFKSRRLVKEHRFDVLHHLTGGMDWMPSGLALVPGKFVWGPVGSENTYPPIRLYLSPSARLKDYLRVGLRGFMRHLDPFVRITGARASIILTHTIETMPKRYEHKMHAFTQTGIENTVSLAKPKDHLNRGFTLRLIFAGDLEDWKGAFFALRAALKFFETEPNAYLKVVGQGPLRREMEATTSTHPHGGRVKFLGRLSMEALTKELNKSDVFIYPSFHHGLATIVLQAMLTGLPIVCVEGDATARVVGTRAGITVSLANNIDPVAGLANALQTLAQDELKRQQLAATARAIAISEYNYDRLAENLEGILATVSAGLRPTLPIFGN